MNKKAIDFTYSLIIPGLEQKNLKNIQSRHQSIFGFFMSTKFRTAITDSKGHDRDRLVQFFSEEVPIVSTVRLVWRGRSSRTRKITGMRTTAVSGMGLVERADIGDMGFNSIEDEIASETGTVIVSKIQIDWLDKPKDN